MNKPVVVVFSGYNSRAILAFYRTLVKHEVDFAVVSSPGKDEVYKTAYVDNVVARRGFHELDLADISNCLKEVSLKFPDRPLFIAPSTEALNRFLLSNRDYFEARNCIIPLSDKRLYESVSDKISFRNICQKHGLAVPEEYRDIHTGVLPLVAKPKIYGSGILKPQLIFTEKDRSNFEQSFPEGGFYYQRFILGRSYYLLYYFYRNGKVVKFSQENLVQQPNGESIVAAVSSDFHHSETSDKYVSLFQSIGFHGMVMVEIRMENDTSYMIEANPRFWGPSQLFVDSGVNLFSHLLADYGITSIDENTADVPNEARYFWLGGFMETISAGKKLVYHRNNEREFLIEFEEYIANALYRRNDSIEIFLNQLTWGK